ncbi:elongin C [Schizosaccharomyces japonicus yFS275]|uniref:Elongin-C n=1 Tax=Schizosaccharomyces japonicus (strain yFS275 / FY16936) TaxID=402676 RepID=B6K3M1_SCHJY|nr:elongin C [Schizosaccharomyces japonicus yFS275]EEB08078.2 elongin C [Schizosaccharomyces japonicus yFS275]
MSTEFVKLVSCDGFEYILKKEIACVSGTIKTMLEDAKFAEAQNNECHFPEIRSDLLEKVCDYMHYNFTYKNQTDVPDFDIPPEMVLELLVASAYLDV